MRGFTERLRKGRLALAVIGVVAAVTGTAAFTTVAQARDHGRNERNWDRHDRRDHHGRWNHHGRWERERWHRIQEARAREWRRYNYWHDDYGRRLYYAPSYYAPPAYYYDQPSVSFGLSFRN